MSHWIKETRMKKTIFAFNSSKEVRWKFSSNNFCWDPRLKVTFEHPVHDGVDFENQGNQGRKRRKSNLENMRIAELTLNLISNGKASRFPVFYNISTDWIKLGGWMYTKLTYPKIQQLFGILIQNAK